MKSMFFIPIFLLAFLISCSSKNPVQLDDSSDTILSDKLVGNWANQFGSVLYKSDGTFKISSNHIDYSDSLFSVPATILGSYSIENGILRYQIDEWNIWNNEPERHQTGVESSLGDSRVEIKNDNLEFTPLDILTSENIDKAVNIWGKWTFSRWKIRYNSELKKYELGKEEWLCEFNEDSKSLIYEIRFSLDNDNTYFTQQDKIEYNHPILKWNNNEYHVEYFDNKIHLEYINKLKSYPLKRTN